jgi:hypothetical protein
MRLCSKSHRIRRSRITEVVGGTFRLTRWIDQQSAVLVMIQRDWCKKRLLQQHRFIVRVIRAVRIKVVEGILHWTIGTLHMLA